MIPRTQKFYLAAICLPIVLFLNFVSLASFSIPPKDCGADCFSSEIISVTPDGNCFIYELKIAFSGHCNFELSHFNVDAGCGYITEAYNSEGWPMELNQVDPTTGLGGLKVDNMQGFGKDKTLKNFTVRFKFCPDEKCLEDPECLVLNTAYKAGQCIYYEEIEASCTKPLQVEVMSVSPSCYNSHDGTAKLRISGGKAPYAVMWNNGSTDSLLLNIPGGEYQFTVTDANGETFEGNVTLSNPEPLKVVGTLTNPACNGIDTGAITLQLNGGTGPYSFLWSNGATSKDVNGLAAGSHTVVVTDRNGCIATGTYNLYNESEIRVISNITQPLCGENTLGSIELEAEGGDEPYKFLWSDGVESQNRYNLPEGIYTVTVSGESRCQTQKSYVIKTQTSLAVSARITHANCYNEPVGGIDLDVSGGIPPYAFEWSDGSVTEDLSNVAAGSYSVVVTDASGCQVTYTAYVTQLNLHVYAWVVTPPSCAGAEDATIDTKVFFGKEPYTYEWSNGSTTENLENIGAGQYTLTVTDSAGCSGNVTVEVKDPDPLEVTYTVVPQGCSGDVSYDISLNVSGGSGEYSYVWSNGETASGIFDQEEGTYSVVVTDGNGCSHTEEIVADGNPGEAFCIINEPDSLPVCGSYGNRLTSSVSGAVSYQWSVTSTDNNWLITSSTQMPGIEFTSGGAESSATFTLAILTENGCTTTCSYTLNACVEESSGDGENPGDSTGGDNPGGSDGNDDDSGHEKSCDECFYTGPVEIVKNGDLVEYSFSVNHNSECRYDLSHFTIAIPECAEAVSYSNSMNWPMEIVSPDPVTGISGIKIDNISAFGKDNDLSSFTVYFSLNATGACASELLCYTPEVAYKAATCTYFEQTEGECAAAPTTFAAAYPNPVNDHLTIEINAGEQEDHYALEIMDFQGKIIYSRHWKTDEPAPSFDLSGFKSDLFFVKVTGSDGSFQVIRIFKK